MKDQRGVVYLEMLIGFLPVFMFFLGTLQVADASVAHLVVEHAATTAARAAVVVLPDDGAYYEDDDNAAVHEFKDYRQSDVERAADTILEANGRLDRSFLNVALDKPKYEERELVTAQVTAPYRCLVAMFCPGGLTITASAKLVYQGARYKYEPATGWASSAANRGLENLRGDKAKPGEKKEGEEDPNGKPDDPNKPDDEGDKPGDGNRPDDEGDRPDDGDPTPNDDPSNQPNDPTADNDDPNRPPQDGAERPADPEAQRRADDLRRALPRNLRNTPIVADPTLDGSTVRVHYTHDDRGRITGVEIRVGPDAGPRHIQDHAPTVRAMKRYQGVAGRARALVDKFKSWLTGNPNAGPGTLAWETAREVEKLAGIIENRAKQLEDPNLTDAQRKELEEELRAYEKQLADHQKVLEQVTNEPGRGYVAANSAGVTARQAAADKYKHEVPDPPPGYHWSLSNDGEPIVVRDRVEVDGQVIPSLIYDPATRTFPQKPDTVPPPLYRTDAGAMRGQQPVTPAIRARAKERQKAAKAAATARADVDRAAAAAGITDDVKTKDGDKIIADAKKAAAGDAKQLERIEKVEEARKALTEARKELTQQSEQLGNEMAQEYMKQFDGKNGRPYYTQTQPDPSAAYEPGKTGTFDFVYTDGKKPPDSIVLVEAKGASGELGVGANGTASQGSPEYMRDIARKMIAKETDPQMAEIWRKIAQGKAPPPDVRYVLVQAPVSSTTGDPLPGQVSEFDISTPSDPP